jgi:hypothetical protein
LDLGPNEQRSIPGVHRTLEPFFEGEDLKGRFGFSFGAGTPSVIIWVGPNSPVHPLPEVFPHAVPQPKPKQTSKKSAKY